MRASLFIAAALLLAGCGRNDEAELKKALGMPQDAMLAYEEVRSADGRALCGVEVATMRRFAFHKGRLYRSPDPKVTALCATAVLGGSKA